MAPRRVDRRRSCRALGRLAQPGPTWQGPHPARSQRHRPSLLSVYQGRARDRQHEPRPRLPRRPRPPRRRLGFQIVSIDEDDETTTGAPEDAWREWLAENNRITPADEAAFRVDFGRWLAGLPERKRKMAELLLQGHETGTVSRMLDVTPSAVSQSRTWLQLSWRSFQGEVSSDQVAPDRRPVGRPPKADQGALRRPRSRTAADALVQVS